MDGCGQISRKGVWIPLGCIDSEPCACSDQLALSLVKERLCYFVVSRTALRVSKPRARKEEIAPGIFKAIREVCGLTVGKKKFSTSKASAVLFGFSHPLLRAIAPGGCEAFVYKQWRPMNIIKLRSLQASLKKKAAQIAVGTKELSE